MSNGFHLFLDTRFFSRSSCNLFNSACWDMAPLVEISAVLTPCNYVSHFWPSLQVILTQLPGQEVQFELFDKDFDQDDFLGR